MTRKLPTQCRGKTTPSRICLTGVTHQQCMVCHIPHPCVPPEVQSRLGRTVLLTLLVTVGQTDADRSAEGYKWLDSFHSNGVYLLTVVSSLLQAGNKSLSRHGMSSISVRRQCCLVELPVGCTKACFRG